MDTNFFFTICNYTFLKFHISSCVIEETFSLLNPFFAQNHPVLYWLISNDSLENATDFPFFFSISAILKVDGCETEIRNESRKILSFE